MAGWGVVSNRLAPILNAPTQSLVCPWHGARYDVVSGRMLDAGYRLMTRVLPLGRGVVVERDATVFVR